MSPPDDSSFEKITIYGERVLSDYLGPEEQLASEHDAQRQIPIDEDLEEANQAAIDTYPDGPTLD